MVAGVDGQDEEEQADETKEACDGFGEPDWRQKMKVVCQGWRVTYR